ncbi:MAG: hypothetical protein GY699_04805 [Desulfobacteraceae bacterium]|nr:hypothetical protein [Desulfobacteraceae bacterium]
MASHIRTLSRRFRPGQILEEYLDLYEIDLAIKRTKEDLMCHKAILSYSDNTDNKVLNYYNLKEINEELKYLNSIKHA